MGPKRCIITNWEPYFVVYFQITLVSQRHSSMLVNKNCAFYDNELCIGPCMCYIQEDASVLCTVTGLPFDQMEPSRSMQHRSGNPVRILKSEWDFPDFWNEFYARFYEWVNRPVSHSARHQRPARERHTIRIASRENVNNQAPRNTNFTR